MNWYKLSDYCILNFKFKSEKPFDFEKSRGLSISKAIVKGVEIYTLWNLPSTSLGHFPDAKKAKQAAIEFIEANKTK